MTEFATALLGGLLGIGATLGGVKLTRRLQAEGPGVLRDRSSRRRSLPTRTLECYVDNSAAQVNGEEHRAVSVSDERHWNSILLKANLVAMIVSFFRATRGRQNPVATPRGSIVVQAEATASLAVGRFRDMPIGQYLSADDDVGGAMWDDGGWRRPQMFIWPCSSRRRTA